MKITKKGCDYIIEEKGTNGRTLKITAYIGKEGITLFNHNEGLDFVFEESKPEMVYKIGKMFIAASKIL